MVRQPAAALLQHAWLADVDIESLKLGELITAATDKREAEAAAKAGKK